MCVCVNHNNGTQCRLVQNEFQSISFPLISANKGRKLYRNNYYYNNHNRYFSSSAAMALALDRT